MWDCTPQFLHDSHAQRFVPLRHGLPIPYADVLQLWQEDNAFTTFFNSLLAKAPFPAFRWETPPITTASASRDFEFVLLEAPGLNRAPDALAFAAQFRSAGKHQSAIAFPNLGNDALLVVPSPLEAAPAYVHLAAFVRQAPQVQILEFWRVVGKAMEARLGGSPIWLSTAGMGVSWLHVRLDSKPKYYGFAPYRKAG